MTKKVLATIAVLIVLCAIPVCAMKVYEYGYETGYEEGSSNGYGAGYDFGRDAGYSSGFYAGFSAAGGSRSDAILAQYGIEQVQGSENNTTTTAPPVSGTILSGSEHNGSEITVTADSSSHYVVSLKTASGVERLSFFVRSGETVTVGVPSEYLYVYFASGTSWYGYGKGRMFGEDTVYTKDDDLIDFTEYTWEYTLYPVYDGNFSETPSDESEFFR